MSQIVPKAKQVMSDDVALLVKDVVKFVIEDFTADNMPVNGFYKPIESIFDILKINVNSVCIKLSIDGYFKSSEAAYTFISNICYHLKEMTNTDIGSSTIHKVHKSKMKVSPKEFYSIDDIVISCNYEVVDKVKIE